MELFIPTGSRCLHVGQGAGAALAAWLLEHGCGWIDANASETSALPFEDESFDAALLVGTLDEVVEPRRAAAELCRVLRPGGVLLVTAPNTSHWRRRLARAFHDRHPCRGAFSPASLRCLLLEGGFGMVGVEGPFPWLLGPRVEAFAVRGSTPSRSSIELRISGSGSSNLSS